MKKEERFFSVELKSKTDLKTLSFGNGNHENAVIEGTIGQLQHAAFVDSIILEVVGDGGVLRINIAENEIKHENERQMSEEENSNPS